MNTIIERLEDLNKRLQFVATEGAAQSIRLDLQAIIAEMEKAEPFIYIKENEFRDNEFCYYKYNKHYKPLFIHPQPQANSDWLPMSTAPKDGTLVQLLVEFTENQTEDSAEPSHTIGVFLEDYGWQFAGWNWTHDCFTEGQGTPVSWMLLTPPPVNPSVHTTTT